MESVPRNDKISMGATTTNDDQQPLEDGTTTNDDQQSMEAGSTTDDDQQPLEDGTTTNDDQQSMEAGSTADDDQQSLELDTTTDNDQPMSSLFARSDNEILEIVSAIHVPDDPEVVTSLDIDSLFKSAEAIITDSRKGFFDESSAFNASFKSLGCECPDDETGLESSKLEIPQKLSKYSWGAKALLALKECYLEHESHDQLGKLVEIFKGLLTRPLDQNVNLQRRLKAVNQLTDLINGMLDVIRDIFELHEFCSNNDDPNNPPELAKAIHEATPKIPVSVYWCIITTVACVNQVARLANDEERPHDLSQFQDKILRICLDLWSQIDCCRRERDIILGIYQPPAGCVPQARRHTMADSVEFLRDHIFCGENVQPILIDGGTKKQVSLDVLSFKNLFIFFSSLDNLEVYIPLLNQVHEKTKQDNRYGIVWIPIVEQWTDDLRSKFETLRMDMEWYVVQCFSPLTAGIKYIKEKWRFKDKPILVVMNSVGDVQTVDVLPLIRKTEMQHWPFDYKSLEKLRKRPGGISRFFKA